MIELRPCPACRRHVADEPACVFCGAALPAAPAPRAPLHGRLSRAAVFAGAATLAGCWTGNPPAETPAPDEMAHRATPPPPPPPPPPPSDVAAHDIGATGPTGTIEGTITDQQTGTPLSLRIDLLVNNQQRGGSGMTDTNGRYRFVHVPVGNVRVMIHTEANPRQSPTFVHIAVLENQTVRGDAAVTVISMPRSNIPMPYGAPPARRRVV